MPQCADHKDWAVKILESCKTIVGHEERISSLEDEMESVRNEVWRNSTSLRSRVKGQEDATMNLEKLILENRDMMKTSIEEFGKSMNMVVTGLAKDFNDKLKSMFKIIVLVVCAASVVVGGMFSICWVEIKGIEESTNLQRNEYKGGIHGKASVLPSGKKDLSVHIASGNQGIVPVFHGGTDHIPVP
jgi:hypothetical protein